MTPSNLAFEIIEIENMMAKLSIHDNLRDSHQQCGMYEMIANMMANLSIHDDIIDFHDVQQCGISESVEMHEVELRPEYQIENVSKSDEMHEVELKPEYQVANVSESVETHEVELTPEYQMENVSESDVVYEMELKPEPEPEVAKASAKDAVGFSNLFYVRKWNEFYKTEPNTPKPPSKIKFDDKVKVKNLYGPKEDRKSDWKECARRYYQEKGMKIDK